MDDSFLTSCKLEEEGRKKRGSGDPKKPLRPQILAGEEEGEEEEEGNVEEEEIEEDHHRKISSDQYAVLQRRPVGMRGGHGGGEIVEVEGGHIVRSIGRKDRHSKVCTAKGPRDRRVRLSAHTAIQFYDVQDRLGYDRPSKAVDWLIKNAKAAIDELAELPPWHPTATTAASGFGPSSPATEMGQDQNDESTSAAFAFGGSSSSFLPPSLESDAIADTIKFFFPIQSSAASAGERSGGGGGGGASIGSSSSANLAGFHHQQYPHNILSQSQDLRLSLQSFEDPILHHQQQQQQQTCGGPSPELQSDQSSFFDTPTSVWSEPNQRFFNTGSGYGPYMPALPLHPMFGQNPFFPQRGPLQSNNINSPSFLALTDPASMATAMQQASVMPGDTHGFTSSGFSGFRAPARIQGEEEDDDDDDCEYDDDEEDEDEDHQVDI